MIRFQEVRNEFKLEEALGSLRTRNYNVNELARFTPGFLVESVPTSWDNTNSQCRLGKQ